MLSKPKQVINDLLHSWIPVEDVVFKTIVETLPNSLQAQPKKLSILSENWEKFPKIHQDIKICKKDTSPVAIISKFLPIKSQNSIKFVGFGRLLCGTLKKGDKVRIVNFKKEETIC